jgi:hypothetical protein
MKDKPRRVCECGCGTITNKGPDGIPRRFVRGHNRRGTGSPEGWLTQGQRYIRVNGKPRALHRVIMEQRLGRQLSRDEVVHHIDFDPLNNDPDNLAVLSRRDHFLLHVTQQTAEPWTDEEIQSAIDLYRGGMTIDQVSRSLGRSYYATRRQLNKWIILRRSSEAREANLHASSLSRL